MSKEYYYIDISLETMEIVGWGVSDTANHTGDTGKPGVHRMYTEKGQYNKLLKKIAVINKAK